MGHEYETLTKDLAYEYMKIAKNLNVEGNQNIGERRELAKEIQKRFGATEIMAINILNGWNISDYIAILNIKRRKEGRDK